MRTVKNIYILPLLLTLISCANPAVVTVTEAGTTCQSAQAQILVMDGFLKRLCGCVEASGTQVGVGTSLDCTVAAGTTVFFHYVGTRMKHQIVPTVANSFTASAPRDPDRSDSVLAHGVVFNASGTYGYQDFYFPNLIGQIIVP
jgi:hypothetical protein